MSGRDSSAADIFSRIDEEDTLQQIKETFQAAQNDKNSAKRCQDLIMSLNEQLDHIDQKQERPKLENRANQALERAEGLITEELAVTYESQYGILKGELKLALEDQDNKLLDQATGHMEAFIHHINGLSPEYWIDWFQFAEKQKSEMKDQDKANKLFSQGRKAINTEDLESLKAAVIQLMRLLPSEVQDKMEGISNIWVDI
ncbi:MAG: hypothetical protein V1789_04420 [PVC group bacterium]